MNGIVKNTMFIDFLCLLWALTWTDLSLRHWLAVLRGETTATAPAEYVAGLFDGYAETGRVCRGEMAGL